MTGPVQPAHTQRAMDLVSAFRRGESVDECIDGVWEIKKIETAYRWDWKKNQYRLTNDHRFCYPLDASCGVADFVAIGKPIVNEAATVVRVDSQLRALRCIEALQELVRLKDMKLHEAYMRSNFASETSPMRDPAVLERCDRMKADYEARKDKAWAAARDALK